MAQYFVVQPNGLLAEFSTVVDDFTCLNMTEAEAVQMTIDEAGERAKREAEQAIEWARRKDYRWEECLFTIKSVHGAKAATKRRKDIEGGTPE